MAIDSTTPRTRRAILAGLAGGLAAALAGTLGRAQPASAHDPDDVRLGDTNATTSETVITNATRNDIAFSGYATGGGTGVSGYSPAGIGVWGFTLRGTGVSGSSQSGRLPAVIGVSSGDNTGLQGYSGPAVVPPTSAAKTGVQGTADTDANSVGVRGHSPTGRGGQFGGKLAQLRLVPSRAETHPARGSVGDLFLDRNKRLWFCKGGTTWVKLA